MAPWPTGTWVGRLEPFPWRPQAHRPKRIGGWARERGRKKMMDRWKQQGEEADCQMTMLDDLKTV